VAPRQMRTQTHTRVSCSSNSWSTAKVDGGSGAEAGHAGCAALTSFALVGTDGRW
jgi:hypothetical protein